MKPHELRIAQEHARQARHLRNLRLFIDDPTRFNRIDPRHQALILEQADALSCYVDILEKRLALFNIPV